MKVLLISIGCVIGLVVLFIVWRLIATFQAAIRRDKQVSEEMASIVTILESGKTPSKADINKLAERKHTRRALYEVLDKYGKTALFPERYMTKEAAAEADLVYWLLHPTELGSAPDNIELMTKVNRQYEGTRLEYYVFRYKMNEPHSAAKDGWMVGISGPYFKGSPLYAWAPGTFSTFEKYASKTPDEHVDWLHETMIKKGMYKDLIRK